MKLFRKVLLVVCVALGFGLSAMLVFPQLAPSSYVYFDINNGKTKYEWKCFGLVYRVRVEETDYSKLLQRVGMTRAEANSKLDPQIRRGVFSKDYLDYEYGRIAADAEGVAMLLDVNSTNMVYARKEIHDLQGLIAKGDSAAIKRYLVKVQTSPNYSLLRRD